VHADDHVVGRTYDGGQERRGRQLAGAVRRHEGRTGIQDVRSLAGSGRGRNQLPPVVPIPNLPLPHDSSSMQVHRVLPLTRLALSRKPVPVGRNADLVLDVTRNRVASKVALFLNPYPLMKKWIVEFIGTFFLVMTVGLAVRQNAPLA